MSRLAPHHPLQPRATATPKKSPSLRGRGAHARPCLPPGVLARGPGQGRPLPAISRSPRGRPGPPAAGRAEPVPQREKAEAPHGGRPGPLANGEATPASGATRAPGGRGPARPLTRAPPLTFRHVGSGAAALARAAARPDARAWRSRETSGTPPPHPLRPLPALSGNPGHAEPGLAPLRFIPAAPPHLSQRTAPWEPAGGPASPRPLPVPSGGGGAHRPPALRLRRFARQRQEAAGGWF